ncbi:MAG TPA: ParB/RepB/Spo0J family partition protein [Phycisphaerae bacterium]|nr:ParB/RepB/Spo0J family partition protein [Phycisphaerae bacterium]
MSKDQKRLGRGLSSLMAPSVTREGITLTAPPATGRMLEGVRGLPSVNRLTVIPVDAVRSNPAQPRKTFDEASLASLAASLRERGTLQPIVVRPAGDGYELVAGERRLRAARLAGLTELPAIVRSTGDDEMLELALVENIQRTDLNAVERARGYRSMQEVYGLSQEEIGNKMGEDRATVANYIRLLGLPPEVLEMVADGRIGMGHARALLGCKDIHTQLSLVSRLLQEGWSVRRLEREVAHPRSPAESSTKQGAARPAVKDLAERLSAALGAKVHIKEGRRRHSGRIIIEYTSLDEFQRIAALLGVGDDGA